LTTLPAEIGYLEHLSMLDIEQNPIESLPEEMELLEGLQEIYIPAGFDMNELPDNIRRLLDDDDLEEDGEAPQGIAYEIHNAFDTFDKTLYMEVVQVDSEPDVPLLEKYDGFVIQNSEKNRIYSKLLYLLNEKYSGDTPKEDLKARIDQIFDERIQAIELSATHLDLIQQTLNKLIVSNHIPTINMYLETYTLDCVHAYPFNPDHPDASRMSCAKGVLERFVLNFLSSVNATCCIEDCGVSELRSICAFIGLIDFDKNQEVFSTYLQEWAQVEDPAYASKTASQRKQSLVDYLTEKYSASAPALAPKYKAKIEQKLESPGFVEMNYKCNSKDGLFGIDDCVEGEAEAGQAGSGRYSRKYRTHRNYTRTHKKQQKQQQKPRKSRKSRKRKQKTRKYTRKQIQHIRKPSRKRRKHTRKQVNTLVKPIKPVKQNKRNTRKKYNSTTRK